MTFLDPLTAKSVVDIVFQLEQTSRKSDSSSFVAAVNWDTGFV